MKLALALVVFLFASSSFAADSADCYKNARGKTVCGKNGNAAAYNPNTGKAVKSTTNENGVKTTTSSTGTQVKSKNGKGVAKGPGGKTCVKTASGQKCN